MMLVPSYKNSSKLSFKKAFTLLELTIVLLIVSAVTGAVWIAANKVWDNYHVYKVNQQLLITVQNIHDYYVNLQKWPVAPPVEITPSLDQLNIFPVEMRRKVNVTAGNTPIDHDMNSSYFNAGVAAPVNGSFDVQTAQNPNTNLWNAVRFSLMGLTQSQCIKLLVSLPINDSELGFLQVGAMNMAWSTLTMSAPVSPSVAIANCTSAQKSEVDIVMKLHN